jgi:hypothetical protein
MESGDAFDAEQASEESGRHYMATAVYVCLDERCPFESESWNASIKHHRSTGHILVERK